MINIHPSMLIYHPNRYLSSYRCAEHLMNVYKEIVGSETNAIFNFQIEDASISVQQGWERIRKDIRVGIQDDLLALEKPATTMSMLSEEWAESVVDELKHLQYTACFHLNGRNIFDLSKSLAQLFRHTDVEDVPIESVVFPYDVLYLYFGPQHDLFIGSEFDLVDGAYVVRGQSGIGIMLTTVREDVNYSSPVNRLTYPDRYFVCNLDQSYGTFGAAFDGALAAADPIRIDNFDEIYQTMQKLPDEPGIRETFVKLAGRSKGLFLRESPVFREALRLVVNGLCYIGTYPNEIEESYPESAPTELIEQIQNTPPAQRKRLVQKITKLGFTRIRFPRMNFTRSERTSEKLGGEVTPYWKRGHWRNQPVGVGRQSRRLTWVRPCKVGGEPQQGHIYQVEGQTQLE